MSRQKLFCLFLLLCLLLPSCKGQEAAALTLIFLDVGQGDALLLRTPDGDILIDAGPDESEELLCLRLSELGVTQLELAVFTHADHDHIGGGDAVLSRFPAKEVWHNGAPLFDEPGRLLSAAIEQCGAELKCVSAGMAKSIGGVRLSVFAPFAGSALDGNAGSIVLKLTCGEVSAILSGDADSEVEAALVAEYGETQLACALYKVGHHGSSTSSSADFLRTMQPTYAVISCGAGNSFGHPMGEVLARLQEAGATVLRTDLEGEITFVCDGKTLERR